MHSVSAREARKIFGDLLTEAQHGAIISITRRGQEVARLVPPEMARSQSFPSLHEFRDSIAIKGDATSQTISEMRDEERF